MNHTPLPWRVYQGWVHPCFDQPSPHGTNGDTAICEPLGPDRVANSVFIVKACNNHYKLLSLLERANAFLGASEPTTYAKKDELAALMKEIPELLAELRPREGQADVGT